MTTIYELHQAAGHEHIEISFDVDGRFARHTDTGVSVDDEGVKHIVLSLSTKPQAEETGEESEVTVDE